MRHFASFTALALIALAIPHAAAACEGVSVLPFALVPVETPAGTYYVYYDYGCDPACHSPDWYVFEETNGVPGLQYNWLWTHEGERCAGETEDTVVL